MRRSAAPSQAGNRPKFVSPFVQKSLTVTGPAVTPSPADVDKDDVKNQHPETKQNKVLKRIFNNSSEEEDGSVKPTKKTQKSAEIPAAKKPRFHVQKSSKFNSPVSAASPTSNSALSNTASSTSGDLQKSYFNVVWCKRSNKKHKKWEGDAVLVTGSRSVTLYDIEGKEIGKSSGYRSTELASLKEDETLPIGGKEIHVMSVLTEEQFKTGTCFLGASSTATGASALPAVPTRVVSKPFNKPSMTQDGMPSVATPETLPVKPRHDPTLPGALVMPRPCETHQWQWNKRGVSVVDVVVDPYLAMHLRPHQREGVTFLYECCMGYRNFSGQGAILADDMGLGKTLQCITLMWTLHKQGPYGGKSIAKKMLVITPGSLVKNWQQEFKKWLGSERLQVYAVSQDKKVEDFMKTSIYPVLIISYEMFVRMFDTIQKMTFDIIVCDEGHRLKNTTIKTTSLIMSLPTQRRVVLTGTPIQNDLQELYSIVEFCNPGILGSSSAFKRIYEEPIVASRQPGASAEQVSLGQERGAELSRLTQMFILRRTADINNKYLPPKGEIVLFCRPSRLQLQLYQQLLRCQLIRSCLSGRLSGSPHLICISALKQLCNHPSLVYNKARNYQETADTCSEDVTSVYQGLYPLFPGNYSPDVDLEQNSGKLAVLAQLLQHIHSADVREKIVVVSNHTKTLDLIQCLCDQKDYQYMRLDGQTPTSKRQEIVQQFNSKHSQQFIFLLSCKAGGVGLNLIGASRLVLYDIDWNPANDLQAMARVWRDGQKRTVYIYRLLTTGSIEEKMYQRQISKQGLSGAIMDSRQSTDVQFSLEDLRDLFSINVRTDCDTHDLLQCDCSTVTDEENTEPVSRQQTSHRSCQLGMSSKADKKKHNVGMDELMRWKHLSSSQVLRNPMWFLTGTEKMVSFVFYSEVKGGNT